MRFWLVPGVNVHNFGQYRKIRVIVRWKCQNNCTDNPVLETIQISFICEIYYYSRVNFHDGAI